METMETAHEKIPGKKKHKVSEEIKEDQCKEK